MKNLVRPLILACLLLFAWQTSPVLAQDFYVQISALGDNDNVARTHVDALDGFDIFDELDTATSPILYFPHPEWPTKNSFDPLSEIKQWSMVTDMEKDDSGDEDPSGVNYRYDVKASYDPLSETKQWTFVVDVDVEVDESGGTSTPVNLNLDFAPSFDETSGIVMQLVNHQTGQTTVLSPPYDVSYTVYYTSQHTFDLIIGTEVAFNDLELIIDVFSNQLSDTGNLAATRANATDGYDSGLDIPEPTPAPSNYLVGSFRHTDWPMGPRFQSDVRSHFDPLIEAKTWPFRVEVETDESGSVLLDFNPNFAESDVSALMLYDATSGQSYNLYPGLTYSYPLDGAAYRDFEITIGGGTETPPPALSPTSRNLAAGWSMVGFPLDPYPEFNTLGGVILDYAPGYAYGFLYAGDQGYLMQNAADSIVPGNGYWVATDQAFNWTMLGDVSPDPVTISLQNGWNLVANPLWFPGPVEGVQVNYQGSTYPWIHAVQLGLIHSSVMDYDTAHDYYYPTQDLTAWKGYWFCAEVDGISLTFDWHQFQVMPLRYSKEPIEDYRDDLSWHSDFIATTDNDKSCVVSFGMTSAANPDFDPWLDVPMAPASPAGGPRMGIMHPEWNMSCGSLFATDFIQPTEKPVAWDIKLTTDEPGEVLLSWSTADWPKELDFQLAIPRDHRVVVMSMRDQTSILLPIDGDGLVVRVRTPDMATAADDLPGFQYSMSVSPNPFNPQTTIFFSIEEPGDVDLKIYTIRGEKVETLSAAGLTAGQHEMVWQGRDHSGRSVPSGSYFIKMYRNGSPVGPVTKMSLIR